MFTAVLPLPLVVVLLLLLVPSPPPSPFVVLSKNISIISDFAIEESLAGSAEQNSSSRLPYAELMVLSNLPLVTVDVGTDEMANIGGGGGGIVGGAGTEVSSAIVESVAASIKATFLRDDANSLGECPLSPFVNLLVLLFIVGKSETTVVSSLKLTDWSYAKIVFR